MEWCGELSLTLQTALVTLVVCGMFIGIAFQPMYWYVFAMSTCLTNYRRRAQIEVETQAVIAPSVLEQPASPSSFGQKSWRNRYKPAVHVRTQTQNILRKPAARSAN
jgi:hypothetical protein